MQESKCFEFSGSLQVPSSLSEAEGHFRLQSTGKSTVKEGCIADSNSVRVQGACCSDLKEV